MGGGGTEITIKNDCAKREKEIRVGFFCIKKNNPENNHFNINYNKSTLIELKFIYITNFWRIKIRFLLWRGRFAMLGGRAGEKCFFGDSRVMRESWQPWEMHFCKQNLHVWEKMLIEGAIYLRSYNIPLIYWRQVYLFHHLLVFR